MNENEAQVCETQMEFDRLMSEMNTEQTHLNHPYQDRIRELAKQKELLEQQKQAINIQLNAIRLERLDIDTKKGVDEKDPMARMMQEAQSALE